MSVKGKYVKAVAYFLLAAFVIAMHYYCKPFVVGYIKSYVWHKRNINTINVNGLVFYVPRNWWVDDVGNGKFVYGRIPANVNFDFGSIVVENNFFPIDKLVGHFKSVNINISSVGVSSKKLFDYKVKDIDIYGVRYDYGNSFDGKSFVILTIPGNNIIITIITDHGRNVDIAMNEVVSGIRRL